MPSLACGLAASRTNREPCAGLRRLPQRLRQSQCREGLAVGLWGRRGHRPSPHPGTLPPCLHPTAPRGSLEEPRVMDLSPLSGCCSGAQGCGDTEWAPPEPWAGSWGTAQAGRHRIGRKGASRPSLLRPSCSGPGPSCVCRIDLPAKTTSGRRPETRASCTALPGVPLPVASAPA